MLAPWRKAVDLIQLVAAGLLSLGSFLILKAVFEADREERRAEARVPPAPGVEERRAA
jgi:hypothetical protein